MKIPLFLVAVAAVFFSCKKDKFTSAPQIKFVDVNPDRGSSALPSTSRELAPKLIFRITDSEGDFGAPGDSSIIYVRHLLANELDSFKFPNLEGATRKDFDGEVTINLFDASFCVDPGPTRPRVDTVFYEIYVLDAKKNKSNVIRTEKPVYYLCN